MTKKIPLDALHRELGAKMVPFAGYAMPLRYRRGILFEHQHTRNAAGLFDLSHMGQIELVGDAGAYALETLVPSSLTDLRSGQQRYTVFTQSNGGILDDLMVTNTGERLFLVVNAARKEADLAHLRAHTSDRCQLTELSAQALLALQGPQAMSVMARIAPGSEQLPFMSAEAIEIDGVECLITRGGYTGEDGFEISLPEDTADAMARRLLAQPEVEAVGLGARDSLRLEAGFCLYGHDIDETTTPVEAALAWIIAPAYRKKNYANAAFPGAEIILAQLQNGAPRRRVGLKPEGRAPVREGAVVFDAHDRSVGQVTSGGFGPTLNAPIAMGYVDIEHAAEGTRLSVRLRNRSHPVSVTALPFVSHRYFHPKQEDPR